MCLTHGPYYNKRWYISINVIRYGLTFRALSYGYECDMQRYGRLNMYTGLFYENNQSLVKEILLKKVTQKGDNVKKVLNLDVSFDRNGRNYFVSYSYYSYLGLIMSRLSEFSIRDRQH